MVGFTSTTPTAVLSDTESVAALRRHECSWRWGCSRRRGPRNDRAPTRCRLPNRRRAETQEIVVDVLRGAENRPPGALGQEYQANHPHRRASEGRPDRAHDRLAKDSAICFQRKYAKGFLSKVK